MSLLFLSSCSKFGRLSKGEGTTVTFSRGDAGVKRVGPDQLGGVIIWGESADTNEQISFVLASNSATVARTFKNASWKFYAVGWEGGSPVMPLKGTARCAVESKTFTGGTDQVVLSLDSDCSDSFFGPGDFLSGSSFRPMNLVSCLADPVAADGDETCDGFGGDYRSFQVVLGAKPAFSELGTYFDPDPADELVSDCYSMSAGVANSVAGAIELPVGDGQTSQIYTRVVAHTSLNCSDPTPDEHVYYHGMYPGVTASGMSQAVAGTTNNAAYFVSGTVPTPTISSLSRSTGGWGGGYQITVNGSNFIPDVDVVDVDVNGVDCEVDTATTSAITCTMQNTTDSTVLNVPQDVTVSNDGVTDTDAVNFTFQDDGMGNGADDLGTGIVEITGTIADASTEEIGGAGGRIFSASRNVYDFVNGGSPSVSTITTRTTFSSQEFAAGDEIIWHVTAARSGTACTSSPDVRGKFGYARITSIPSNDTIVLDKEMFANPESLALQETNRANNAGSDWCVLQIARVPNFRDLHIDATSGMAVVMPEPFSFTDGKGGILSVRVAGEYKVFGNNSAGLWASGKGFAGGTPGFQGDTRDGIGVAGANSGIVAGGGSSAPEGGGGGANEGAGGDGGKISAPSNGANAIGTSCHPDVGCANMGGGGGGGDAAANGGNGGGLAFLSALKTIGVDSTTAVRVFAAGLNGGNETTAGGGGGAGGTALIQTLTGAGAEATVHSEGGSGGDGLSAGAGGGAGSGGTAEFRYCTQYTTRNFSNSGGAATTGSTYNGSAGGAGSLGGPREIILSVNTEWCPGSPP